MSRVGVGPDGAGGSAAGRPAASLRRELVVAVLVCAAGAGLAIAASSRTWAVEVTVRPAPLPELRVPRTGAGLLPWLPPLALVGLAGAGALVATRGLLRRVLGGLLGVVGLAVAAGGAVAPAVTQVAGARVVWPLLSAAGGLAVAGVAGFAVLRGQRWPSMGARYEVRDRAATAATGAVGAAADRGRDAGDLRADRVGVGSAPASGTLAAGAAQPRRMAARAGAADAAVPAGSARAPEPGPARAPEQGSPRGRSGPRVGRRRRGAKELDESPARSAGWSLSDRPAPVNAGGSVTSLQVWDALDRGEDPTDG